MMENKFFILLVITFFFGTAAQTHAEESLVPPSVPRFMTLNADKVNVRAGPGQRYPVKFIFKKEGLPVEITKEFDGWYQMCSKDGDKGWVHISLLSGKRAVIVKGSIRTLFKKPGVGAMPVVKLEPGVIASLDSCDRACADASLDRCNKVWCYLRVAGYKGWIERENIWGVYPDEIFIK